MLNIFKLVGILLVVSAEANKAGRAAFAAKKAEVLELLKKLRVEFDEAVVESLIGAAFAQMRSEVAVSSKDWAAFKKEAREAMNLKAAKEEAEEPENQ